MPRNDLRKLGSWRDGAPAGPDGSTQMSKLSDAAKETATKLYARWEELEAIKTAAENL